jgi:hypothetical protein
MINIKRPIPFVLISSNHGTMIINRNDYVMVDASSGYGVGYQLLNTSRSRMHSLNYLMTYLKSTVSPKIAYNRKQESF